jgi:hypothetical protein
MDPVPDLLLVRKSGSAGNRTWDLWFCSQEILFVLLASPSETERLADSQEGYNFMELIFLNFVG